VKVIVYMTLTANGYFPVAGAGQTLPKEVLADFVGLVATTRYLIVGRRTYEGIGSMGPARALLERVPVVVVTRAAAPVPGALTVPSPQAALDLFYEQGHTTALVAGGAEVDGPFLSAGLFDELRLNIHPAIGGVGRPVPIADGVFTSLELRSTPRLIGEHTVQLEYAAMRS